jgi:ABC-type lipoprotein export system ATPase subunit
MSHGEKQRVAIARAITNNPDLIIADEPTANLKSSQGFEIIRLLREYASKNDTCVIVASHDLRLTEYADCTLYLKDGKVENKVYN